MPNDDAELAACRVLIEMGRVDCPALWTGLHVAAHLDGGRNPLVRIIADAVRQAVAAERERILSLVLFTPLTPDMTLREAQDAAIEAFRERIRGGA